MSEVFGAQPRRPQIGSPAQGTVTDTSNTIPGKVEISGSTELPGQLAYPNQRTLDSVSGLSRK